MTIPHITAVQRYEKHLKVVRPEQCVCKQAVAARGEYQCVEMTSQAMHYCAHTAEIYSISV